MKELKSYKACEKATFLFEKSLNNPLSMAEKVALASHLCMCKACKIYSQQSRVIDSSIEKLMAEQTRFDARALQQRILISLEKL